MKRLTNCMTTAAAVLMMTAGAVSAQSLMKAEVPFAFNAGGRVVEPGAIRVQVLSGNTGTVLLHVYNIDTKSAYLILPHARDAASPQWMANGLARISFDCSTGACFLRQVWFGEGAVYQIPGPKTRGGEMLLTEIAMKPDRAD